MKKTDIWRWVERLIMVGTILGMIYKFGIKDAVWRTEVNMKLETLIKNDEKQEQRMSNQNDINGSLLDYLRDRDGWTEPSEEETEDH